MLHFFQSSLPHRYFETAGTCKKYSVSMKLSLTQQKTFNFFSPKIFHVHIVSQWARGMIVLVWGKSQLLQFIFKDAINI